MKNNQVFTNQPSVASLIFAYGYCSSPQRDELIENDYPCDSAFEKGLHDLKINQSSFNEEEYLVFVLGYDLLHDKMKEDEMGLEIAESHCRKIVKNFMNSEFYHDTSASAYDKLQEYLETK